MGSCKYGFRKDPSVFQSNSHSKCSSFSKRDSQYSFEWKGTAFDIVEDKVQNWPIKTRRQLNKGRVDAAATVPSLSLFVHLFHPAHFFGKERYAPSPEEEGEGASTRQCNTWSILFQEAPTHKRTDRRKCQHSAARNKQQNTYAPCTKEYKMHTCTASPPSRGTLIFTTNCWKYYQRLLQQWRGPHSRTIDCTSFST